MIGIVLGVRPCRPSFSPFSLGSLLKAWWKADGAISLTGALVDQWTDLSGNAAHLTATGAQRPSYNATGLNGRPSVDFAGAQTLQCTYALTQPLTCIFAVRNTGNTTGNRILSDGSTAAARQAFYVLNATGVASLYAGTALSSAVTLAGAYYVATATFDGASSVIRQNGTQVATGAGGAQNVAGITIGGQFGRLSEFWVGPVGEGVVIAGATIAQIQSVERYMGARYGVAVA